MKVALLSLLLSVPFITSAQKLVATHPSITYHVGSEKTFLYRSAADTAAKSKFFLSSGEEALVVGELSPRWIVVNRGGFLFLVLAERLLNYRALPSTASSLSFPVDPETKLITYQGIVEVPGVSKSDLYIRALSWVARSYKSANNVIQMQDKEAGQLIIKGVTNASAIGEYRGVVRHLLSIYVKDGRYKYVLNNLTHDAAGATGMVSGGPLEQHNAGIAGYGSNIKSKVEWPYIRVHATIEASNFMSELQDAMSLKGAKDPSDF